jgi:hypothetical protein
VRKAFSILTALAILLPCVATAEDNRGPAEPAAQPFPGVPASKPPSLFRQIYACEQGKPSSASALGEIAGWKTISVIGRDGKGGALVREALPNEGFGAGVFRGTRLELKPDLACSVAKLAVLAPPGRVEIVRLSEVNQSAAVARVADYFDARNREQLPDANAYERPPFYLTNYRIESAKAFVLTPSYAVVEANVGFDVYDLVTEKPRSPMQTERLTSKYEKADPELNIGPQPMVIVVGRELTELTKPFREGSSICDELVSAFRIGKRTYIHISSTGCANGIKGQMVFDLSGPAPKAVFSDWDLSD